MVDKWSTIDFCVYQICRPISTKRMDQNFNRLTNTLACTCCIRKARYIPLYTPSIDDEWEQWEKARGRTRSLYECEREGLEKRNVEREKEKEREKKEQEKDGNALKCKS